MDITNLFEAAQTAQHASDYQKATALYAQLLAVTEQNQSESDVYAYRAEALVENGRMYRHLGHHDKALNSYTQYFNEANNDSEKVIATALMGQSYSNFGQHQKALDLYAEGLYLAQSKNDTRGRAFVMQGMGATLAQLGRHDEALTQLKKARSLFWQLEDIPEQMRIWNWIGIVHNTMGTYDKAINAYEKALLLVRTVGVVETVIVLSNLGEAYQGLYDMEQALMYHREAISFAEKIPLPTIKIDLRRNIGVELCHLGQIEEGFTELTTALQLSESIGEHYLAMQSLYSLALAELEHGTTAKATATAERLLIESRKNNTRGNEAKALFILGHCAKNEGGKVEAERQWHQALFLAHDTGQYALLWQIHAGLALLEENPELAQTHNRIAAEVIEQIVYPFEDDFLRTKFLNAAPIRAVLDQLTD
ncbi:MAG: tetratricopeptide repeat protein [Chloroflexi bacterium]|nr:tetratricopeptide repeat protein [Chloroflexota bacterium]